MEMGVAGGKGCCVRAGGYKNMTDEAGGEWFEGIFKRELCKPARIYVEKWMDGVGGVPDEKVAES